MKVKLQLQTTTGSLPWEYNTEIVFKDVTNVLEWATRHAVQFNGVPWFMSMLIWKMDDEPKLLATIKLDPPSAHAFLN